MPTPTNCQPCCTETQVTNVPGVEGDPGADGENGQNAYTVTTTDTTVPAIAANVTADVENSDWMVIGQVVAMDGPAHFEVLSKPDSISAELKFLGYAGDVAATTVIASGATVAPAGIESTVALTSLTVYGAGTAYAVTTAPALIDMGTTDPTLTITSAGTWLITSRIRFDYTAATFAAVRTVSSKLRRTNNTAADLTNAASGWKTDIITTLTYTAQFQVLPPVVYVTANADDVIQLWTSVNTGPTAGTLDVVECEIAAIKIA